MNSLINIQNIYWREPLWLLLAFQPIFIILLKEIVKKNKISLYADIKLQPWVVFPTSFKLFKNIFSKNTTYLIAWLLLSVALSGPRIPLSQTDKEQFFGANIMLVVDLSRSMKAMDITPNRLRRAKIEIYELLEKAKEHRVGVTVFAARPHLFVPLTSDHAVLKKYLESLDNLSFPTMGSKPVSALLFAHNELLKTKGKSSIILITDGDFPTLTENQSNQLQKLKIPFYILGVGTVEGEAIQIKDGTWLKYENQDIVSRTNETILQQLATLSKGKYSPVYDDNSDWDTLYDNGIANLNTVSDIDAKQQIVWRELFSYFLLPSILLFWFSLSKYRFKGFNHVFLLSMLSISMVSIPESDANAFEFGLEIGQTMQQSAYREYSNKNYEASNKLYQNIPGYEGYIGQGNSLYKMGHYQEAGQKFISATLSSETNPQRVLALYNLANSHFRMGSFSSAITTYNDVLRYQPENEFCSYNIKISKILKKNIEQRIKEREKIITASRQGRGPRSANIEDGTDISENSSVSAGSDKNTLNDNIPLPELPDINDDEIKALILTGLKNIRLAEQGQTTKISSTDKNISTTDLLNVQQQINILSDSQHLLWKRLFEIEEGFPAPVEKPKVLPGLKPW